MRNSNDVQNRTEPKTNSQIVFDATYQKRKNKKIVNSDSEFEKGNLPYSDNKHLRQFHQSCKGKWNNNFLIIFYL